MSSLDRAHVLHFLCAKYEFLEFTMKAFCSVCVCVCVCVCVGVVNRNLNSL